MKRRMIWVAAALCGAAALAAYSALAQSRQAAELPPRLEPMVQVARQPVIYSETFADENGQTQTRVWQKPAPGTAADSGASGLPSAEIEAAKEAQELVQELQSAESDSAQAELKAKLRAALTRQFEAQQQQRTREIASIEEQLSKLRETHKKRDAAKETIVDRRLDQLTGVKDELAWDETPGVPAGLPVPGISPGNLPLLSPGSLRPPPTRGGKTLPGSPFPTSSQPGISFPATTTAPVIPSAAPRMPPTPARTQ